MTNLIGSKCIFFCEVKSQPYLKKTKVALKHIHNKPDLNNNRVSIGHQRLENSLFTTKNDVQ